MTETTDIYNFGPPINNEHLLNPFVYFYETSPQATRLKFYFKVGRYKNLPCIQLSEQSDFTSVGNDGRFDSVWLIAHGISNTSLCST